MLLLLPRQPRVVCRRIKHRLCTPVLQPQRMSSVCTSHQAIVARHRLSNKFRLAAMLTDRDDPWQGVTCGLEQRDIKAASLDTRVPCRCLTGHHTNIPRALLLYACHRNAATAKNEAKSEQRERHPGASAGTGKVASLVLRFLLHEILLFETGCLQALLQTP